MENEFSKPKVLIDLEEYEFLKDCDEELLKSEHLIHMMLDFMFKFKWAFGIMNHKNDYKFELSSVIKEEPFRHQELFEYLENYINTQLIIERELPIKENK